MFPNCTTGTSKPTKTGYFPLYPLKYSKSRFTAKKELDLAEVQAVKDLDTVKLISHLLKRTYGQQIADVWDVGLNPALRISDLLSIKFEKHNDERLNG